MPLAAIGLGANLPSGFGSPSATIARALACLERLGRVTAVSSLRSTHPVGYRDQPDFLNGACLLETQLEPLPLLAALLAIERSLGRMRDPAVAKGPRTIDLDLLLYDAAVLDQPGLTLPHPELARRAFVLEPLAEIAPAWVHPLLGRSIADLWAEVAPAA